MAEGYAMVEALGFCTKYMQEFIATTQRVWNDKEDPSRNDKEDPSMNDEVLEGNGLAPHLSFELRQWIHEFVVNNEAPLEDWRR